MYSSCVWVDVRCVTMLYMYSNVFLFAMCELIWCMLWSNVCYVWPLMLYVTVCYRWMYITCDCTLHATVCDIWIMLHVTVCDMWLYVMCECMIHATVCYMWLYGIFECMLHVTVCYTWLYVTCDWMLRVNVCDIWICVTNFKCLVIRTFTLVSHSSLQQLWLLSLTRGNRTQNSH